MKMEELIVDDIPIFTRVLWFAAILKTSKCVALRCKQSANQTNELVVLVELLFIYIYMIYVRWLKWWCGWECSCLSWQKFSNTRPPDPLAQVQWYHYRACAFEWCAKFGATQSPPKVFHFPNVKGSRII